MRLADLMGKIDLTPTLANGIIAAGPMTNQPASMPCRTVLVAKQVNHGHIRDGFTVWTQTFPPNDPPAFSNGDYFAVDDLPNALKCFANRLQRESEFVGSIYREIGS